MRQKAAPLPQPPQRLLLMHPDELTPPQVPAKDQARAPQLAVLAAEAAAPDEELPPAQAANSLDVVEASAGSCPRRKGSSWLS